MSLQKCPFCGHAQIENIPNNRHITAWKCPTCGTVENGEIGLNLSDLSSEDRRYLSAYARKLNHAGQILEIHSGNRKTLIDEAKKLRPTDILQVQNAAVLYLGSHSDLYGSFVPLIQAMLADLVLDSSELDFLLRYMQQAGLIEKPSDTKARLTVKGWEEYSKLRSRNLDSKQAFVAMSFSGECREIFDKAIEPACKRAGFDAYRVDQDRHIENINNRIIAKIKESRFVIAEFTEHKEGVYFETGYGLGLGLPVIWICKRSDFGGAHFDTKPFNHILWDDLEKLKDELYWSIKANIV